MVRILSLAVLVTASPLANLVAFPSSASAEVRSRGPIEFLQSEMKRQQIPGVQLAVARHGKLITLGAFGLASIELQVPVSIESIFPINSCTKAFTGVALMQLVDEGKIDLDAPVSRYLDDLPAAWRKVTLRQMATHTSGLPEYWIEREMLVPDDFQASWAKVKALPLAFKPGERVQYNQTNYLLLQWIIEKLSGKTFTQFVTERQFNVVGMPLTARAGWGDDYQIQPGKVRVYSNVRNLTKSGDWGDFPGGNSFSINTQRVLHIEGASFASAQNSTSGLESTAQEIALWLIALQEGKLISKESLKEIWKPAVLNNGRKGMWGIGWPSYERGSHPVALPTGGGRAAFAVYPDDDLIVVLLTNLLGGWPERMIDEIAAHYLSDPEMYFDQGFGLAPRLRPLHIALVARNFDLLQAPLLLQELRSADPTIGSPEDLKEYALYLFFKAQYALSLEIFKLNARLHPESLTAQQALASAYLLNGDEASADRTHEMAERLKRKNTQKR